MKRSQFLVSVGILALGVGAALPFQRSRSVVSQIPTGETSSSGLQVRGSDAPEHAIRTVPLEVSVPGGSLPRGDVSEPAESAAPAAREFPEIPRLARSSELPRIADSFSSSSPVVGATAAENERASRQTPDAGWESLAPKPAGPVSVAPVSVAPVSGVPVSGVPVSGVPVSGTPEAGVHLGVPQLNGDTGLASSMDAPSGEALAPSQPTPVRREGPAAGAVAENRTVRKHRIRDGDTLPDLARRYLGDASRFMEIFEANRETLARPDLLPLNAVITIPETSEDGWRPASHAGGR